METLAIKRTRFVNAVTVKSYYPSSGGEGEEIREVDIEDLGNYLVELGEINRFKHWGVHIIKPRYISEADQMHILEIILNNVPENCAEFTFLVTEHCDFCEESEFSFHKASGEFMCTEISTKSIFYLDFFRRVKIIAMSGTKCSLKSMAHTKAVIQSSRLKIFSEEKVSFNGRKFKISLSD